MGIVAIIGWIGALLIVGAYYLNMNGKLKSNSSAYIICNLIGGVFFIINSFVHKAYASLLVVVVWVIIALAAILKKK
jgi:hypothetical protein